MTPVDRFLSSMQHVRPKGSGGWTARCPAHPDTENSLSIDVNKSGAVLLRCFAGCAVEAIADAVGLSMSDLFQRERASVSMSDSPRSRPATIAAFANAKGFPVEFLTARGFRDVSTLTADERARYGLASNTRDGILIPYRQIDGSLAKRHRHRRALTAKDGSFWTPGAAEVVPYLLDEIERARKAKAVAICEGETDALALLFAGLPALGVPGATMWNTLTAAHVAGITRAYLMRDSDAAGQGFVERGIAQLQSFGVPEIYVVRMPDGCKDVLDLYRREGGATDKAATFRTRITALMKAARDAGPAMATTDTASPAGEASTPNSPSPVVVCMADVQPEAIRWLWPQRWALGKLTLLLGDPGVGKSTLTLDLIARITRGAAWPDGGQAPEGNVILLTCEDGLADTIRPRLDRQGADVARVFAVPGIRETNGVDRMFSLERDLTHLRTVIDERQPIALVIDPVSAYFGTDRDSYRDNEVRAVLGPLVVLAEQTGIGIWGLVHPTKASTQKSLYRVMGSQAFAATARIVLGAGKDPQDERRCYLMGIKENICRRAATLAYEIGADQRLAWSADPVEGITADAILSGAAQVPDEDRDDAADFLRQLLATGPVSQREVEAAGKGAGWTMSQLRRAKRKAGVEAEKSGFRDGWYWRLRTPVDAEDDALDAPKMPKMTHTRTGVIFGENAPGSPLESTPFPKMTQVSSSTSSSGAATDGILPEGEPLDLEWGEV